MSKGRARGKVSTGKGGQATLLHFVATGHCSLQGLTAHSHTRATCITAQSLHLYPGCRNQRRAALDQQVKAFRANPGDA